MDNIQQLMEGSIRALQTPNQSHSDGRQTENASPTHPSENLELPQKTGRKVTISRELKNLEPINLPGVLEKQNAKSATRVRSPSYRRALLIYTDALEAIQVELDEFNAQQYLDSPFAELPNTDLKSRFKSLRSREQVLRVASNDLLPLLEK